MPEDPRIDSIKSELESIKADDISEDAAYEAKIALLQDTINTSLASLSAAKASLEAAIINLESRVSVLEHA